MPSVSFAPIIGDAVRKALQIVSPRIEEIKKENDRLKERIEKIEAEVLILRELVYKTKQQ